MRKLGLILGISIVAILSACGGGGGSPGDTQEAYSIKLRSDKKQLPININPGINTAGAGAYSPYTTTLYVEAREGSRPIQGGEDIFACNIVSGFESGALYYLDGDDEHEDEDGNPLAYRSVVLGANSGAATFHFHSGTKAGTARIVCSVTNPRDNQVSSAAVDIVVGANTGLPASVLAVAQAPGYLGSQFNPNNIRNSVGIQAFVMDDANQPIPDPGAGVANLQVSILPTTVASEGARLLAGGSQQYSNLLNISTNGGVGLFSLSSGPSRGVILLEFQTDRYDNNITNGIQDPVVQLMAVNVVDVVASEPLAATEATLTATNGTNFAYALEATGGVPPYSWTVSGGLPAGLTHSNGIISGTPKAPPGEYTVSVRVTDETGATASATIKITVDGDLPLDPLVITGCTSEVTTACALPNATLDQLYRYPFSATGGDPEEPITWAFSGQPTWLGVLPDTGSTGVISGTPPSTGGPPPTACGVHTFFVTATRGTMTVTRQFSVRVVGNATTPCP